MLFLLSPICTCVTPNGVLIEGEKISKTVTSICKQDLICPTGCSAPIRGPLKCSEPRHVLKWVVRIWHLKSGQEIKIISSESRFQLAPKVKPEHC